MSSIEIPYLWQKGGAWYYRRARGKKWFTARIRRQDGTALVPGQPGFSEAYERLHGAFERTGYGIADRQPFGVVALAASYRAQPEWSKKAKLTQTHYLRRIAVLEDQWPNADMTTIDRRDCMALRAELAQQSASAANEAMAMLAVLLNHAIDLGWRRMGDNPASRMPELETGDGKGYKAWRAADVRKVLDHPDVPIDTKRLLVCAYYTGLRRSDLVALTKLNRANGVITCNTKKTDARAYIPEDPELTKWLDTGPQGSRYLLTLNGHPWSDRSAGRAVTEAVRKVGLSGLSLHGLRKTRTIELVENGATDAEVEALIPHADPKQTQFYRAQADQKVLAERAMVKMTNGKEKTNA